MYNVNTSNNCTVTSIIKHDGESTFHCVRFLCNFPVVFIKQLAGIGFRVEGIHEIIFPRTSKLLITLTPTNNGESPVVIEKVQNKLNISFCIWWHNLTAVKTSTNFVWSFAQINNHNTRKPNCLQIDICFKILQICHFGTRVV